MPSKRPLRLGAAAALVAALALVPACARFKQCAYEGRDRDAWQQPERVVAALGLEPGQRVADVGAGSGYFTFRLADAVAPGGRVYAVDVDPDMAKLLEERVRERGRDDVTVILAAPDDPRLPEPVDLVLVVNTYHHLEARPGYFGRLAGALRPGGRVAVVEYRPKGWTQKVFPHSTEAGTIRAEMEEAGYRLLAEHDWLERQAFLVFGR